VWVVQLREINSRLGFGVFCFGLGSRLFKEHYKEKQFVNIGKLFFIYTSTCISRLFFKVEKAAAVQASCPPAVEAKD
jgi:hypothetical protein